MTCVRLAYHPEGGRTLSELGKVPAVRLAVAIEGGGAQSPAAFERHLASRADRPALLVSYVYLKPFQPGRTETAFESLATDQMVVVSGIRVWSLCEHHLLPFWCEIAIGYVATDRVLGLSKFARIAHQCAHRLQVQERLTHEIADAIQQVTGAADVAVLGRGEHLCMTMRGIRTPALMTSSVMRGAFLTTPAARAEFLQLVGPPRA
jgi:GTP cyclohydrolase I